MKNLIKKILKPLTPLIFAGSLLLAAPQPSVAESSDFNISAGAGAFRGSDENISEIYGIFPTVRLGLGYSPKGLNGMIDGRFEGGVDFSYAWKDGTPKTMHDSDSEIDASSNLSMLTIRPGIKYYFGEKGEVSPYIGLFVPWVLAVEKASAVTYYDGKKIDQLDVEATASGIGIEGAIGVDIPATENLSVFIECGYRSLDVKINTVKIDSKVYKIKEENATNMGGVSLNAGLKYNF